MTRVLELLVSLLIVGALIVLVGVFLPSSGRVERSVEVSSPVRQIYDTINTLQRFPEWSAERRMDPTMRVEFSGPRDGVGAKATYTAESQAVGDGSLEIASSDQDSQVKYAVTNTWAGTNKSYTIRIDPAANAKTSRIYWTYEVDYGWNLMWRYAGLYIHGTPDNMVQANVANLANMLAAFPNTDYSNQDIQVADVVGKPMLFLSVKAPRTLDEVAEATDAAAARIEAVMKKAGLNAAGPRMTITSNWGDDSYSFDVAIPVDNTTFTLDKNSYTIPAATSHAADGSSGFIEDEPATPATTTVGQVDDKGYLVLEDEVRATTGYTGKALVTDYTGSPAALPLLRLQEKAWAETHGYEYSEMNGGRFWDEITGTDEAGESTYRVYLPVTP